MSGCPDSLAGVAVLYISVDVLAHPGPVVASTEEFQGFGASGVASRGGVVVAAKEFQA
jgi:hypothetical protein